MRRPRDAMATPGWRSSPKVGSSPRPPPQRKGKPVRKPPPLYAISCGAYKAKLEGLRMQIRSGASEEMRAVLAADMVKWGRLSRKTTSRSPSEHGRGIVQASDE